MTFPSPVVTGGTAPVTTACTPPSGINFSEGTTPVTCTATDAKQRTASCSFTVTVNPAPIPLIGLTRFVAFGDSITLGQDGQDDPNATPLGTRIQPRVIVHFPYPARLLQDLNDRYTNQAGQFVVDNAGCGGEALSASYAGGTTQPPQCAEGAFVDAVARFGYVIRRGAISGGPYSAVLIMEGSNDVTKVAGDATISGRAMSALQSMIEYAKLFNVRPYVATIPPQNADGFRGGGASNVFAFNAQVAALAASEGVPLVDVYNNIDPSMLAPDGLHLRQVGYDKMAQVFLAALEATAETSTSSSLRKSTLLRTIPRSTRK